MSPRAYCALQCAVPAILIILDRRGGSTCIPDRPRPLPSYALDAPLVCGCGLVRYRPCAILAPTTRVRQRIAIEIWSNYQDYICARLKFADPTPDKQRANEDEAVTNAAEQELHAQRYAIQAYLHRTHQPLELGVQRANGTPQCHPQRRSPRHYVL